MTFDTGTWQLIFLAISGGATIIGLLIGLIFKFVILKPISKVEESNLELSKNIGDLATAITELQKFSSVQNEKNSTDKEKIDVLFTKYDKLEYRHNKLENRVINNESHILSIQDKIKSLGEK